MTLVKQAITLSSIGFSVLPVDGKTKKPLIAWEGLMSEKAIDTEIEGWFKQWPEASIGVVTGRISDCLVFDVDPRHKGDISLFKKYKTVVSRTGGGGWHYFFKYPQKLSVKNTVELFPGVDVRGDGGYVIVPPSTHLSGKHYSWIKNPFQNKMVELPEELMTKLQEERNEFKTFDPELLGGVPEGQRNDSAARVIGKFLRALKPEEFHPIGWPMAKAWNEKNNPPISEWELGQVFQSIAGAEQQAQKNKRQNLTLKGLEKMSSVNSLENGVSQKTVSSVNLSPVLLSEIKSEPEDLKWIWKGYLARGRSTLLSALWKSGKSTLLSHMFKAMEKEELFAGQSTTKCRVLVLSEEILSDWGQRRDELNLTLPVYIISRPINAKLHYHEWVKLIQSVGDFCQKEKIEVVIIDTLSGFWSAQDENDASKVQADMLPINYLLKKNLAVMLIHHFRKSGGGEGTASRGSGVLGSSVDILVEFSRLDQDGEETSRRTLKTYSRYKESPKEVVIDLVDGEYQTIGTRTEVKLATRKNQLLTLIPESPEGIATNDIYSDWDEEIGTRPTKRTIQRLIKDLETNGKIKVEKEIMVGRKKTPLYSKKTNDTNKRHDVLANDGNRYENKRNDNGNTLEDVASSENVVSSENDDAQIDFFEEAKEILK